MDGGAGCPAVQPDVDAMACISSTAAATSRASSAGLAGATRVVARARGPVMPPSPRYRAPDPPERSGGDWTTLRLTTPGYAVQEPSTVSDRSGTGGCVPAVPH